MWRVSFLKCKQWFPWIYFSKCHCWHHWETCNEKIQIFLSRISGKTQTDRSIILPFFLECEVTHKDQLMLLEIMSHLAVAVTEAGTTTDTLKAKQLAIHYRVTSGECQKSLHKSQTPNYEVIDLEKVYRTLYVSQFLKKLTDPSTLLWITVQPPGSCLWSHHTCISRLAFSGFTRYMPLAVWPSSRACRQSLNGPEQMVGRS